MAMTKHQFESKKFRVKEDSKVELGKLSTKAGKEFSKKEQSVEALSADNEYLSECQERLYAEGKRSLLVILQGMDASGKDGTIRHVMHGINPQGCRVHSFGPPNNEELLHHFLWRPMRFLPGRGMISIFNRSYYEEVIVVRVHPQFLEPQKLPPYKKLGELWKSRYKEIRTFEETMVEGGTTILKFFLHISRDEQKARLLERLLQPEKAWKFNPRDLEERKRWSEYQEAFEDAISATSTKSAPWFIIPADDKWYARAVVADIIASELERLDLEYPKVTKANQANFEKYIEQLKRDE
jgi:PPK2 family polyphosphate:nucleotide phosphotransferase